MMDRHGTDGWGAGGDSGSGGDADHPPSDAAVPATIGPNGDIVEVRANPVRVRLKGTIKRGGVWVEKGVDAAGGKSDRGDGPTNPERRHFIKGTGKFLASAATVAVAGVGAKNYLLDAEPYDLALLKLDENGDLALAHRTMTVNDSAGMVETTKLSIDGLDAGTLAKSGEEALVISPDFVLKPHDLHKNAPGNIDGKHIAIKGSTSNLYLPYDLLLNAQSFTAERTLDNTLVLTITSLPEMKEPTAQEWADYAVALAKHKTAQAQYEAAMMAYNAQGAFGPIWEGAKKDLGLGESKPTAQAPPAPPGPPPAEPTAKPVTASTTITLDCPHFASIPSIHFYNKAIDNPSHTMPGDMIAREISCRAENRFAILEASPMLGADGKPLHDDDGLPLIARRYATDELTRTAANAQKCKSCSPEKGLLPMIWDAAKEIFVADSSLPERELHALAMATRFQQGKLEARGTEGTPCERFKGTVSRFVAQITDHDRTPGR